MGLAGMDADERLIAKSALEAAEERLQSLCASHAGTFVAVERRGQALEASLKELLSGIQTVEDHIEPAKVALEQEDDQGESSLAALSEKHRVRRRTLLQHSSLLELLELPSLMDACVRSNLYDEALSISAFANTLERRHTEKNPVVLKVVEQIRSRQQDLRRHLLFSLKSQVTMPECLEIVTSLRRLNSIDLERLSEANLERVHTNMELSLQVDFLEARDAWLEKPSNPVAPGIALTSRSNSRGLSFSSEQLLDSVERYRTRMFEIATQFNAIFRAQTSLKDMSLSLLTMWISRRVEGFLTMLQSELQTMDDSASVRDAWDACVFFATSMGRLGADFSPRLPPLFESTMLSLVERAWKEGIQQLSNTLKVCREAGVASPLFNQSIDTVQVPIDENGDPNALMSPPRLLMALPALARLVNAFLTGLNELRRCLLPGLFADLRICLDSSLTEALAVLKMNERAVLTPGLRGDAKHLREAATEMKKVMAEILEPYVRGSLEYALGNIEKGKEYHSKLAALIAEKTAVKEEAEVEKEDDAEEEVPPTADSNMEDVSETVDSVAVTPPIPTPVQTPSTTTSSPRPPPPPPKADIPAKKSFPLPPPRPAITTTSSSAAKPRVVPPPPPRPPSKAD